MNSPLREQNNIRQVPGEKRRRWFSSDDMDLTVWYDERNAITGFELCYDKGPRERSVRWRKDTGFLHERVDDGEGRPGRHKATPILVPDGLFAARSVAERFLAASREIEGEVASFVHRKLLEYPAGHS